MDTTKPGEVSQAKTIEQEIDELQGIVATLEKNALGLEESLELFERGVALVQSTEKRIADVETRLEILTKRGGKVEPEPLGR